jgi:HAD superfamily hydrolase (TIGR01490 family)
VEAAFFDLDKTVIARPSMMALAPAFRSDGLLPRRALMRGAWFQLRYVRFGAGPEALARVQKAALEVTRGWSQERVGALVTERLADAIDPITYREALEAMAAHRRAGRRVLLVSAAPEDLVAPIGRRLGVDAVIASRPQVGGDGRYTGSLESYAYGPAKAVLVRDLSRREGIDLDGSWAYSDSFTDLPLLETVGHPVAVNPDRALRRVARMRGWPVERWEQRVVVLGPGRLRRAAPVSAAALAATGGLTLWWVLRRSTQVAP